jgi:spermidine synthase
LLAVSAFGYPRSDPESEVPFAKALYSDDTFMRAFYNSLSDDGILVMQLGEAPASHSPDETYSKFKNRAATTRFLEKLGFKSIHTYDEVSYCFFVLLFEASGILMFHFAPMTL